MINDNIEAAFSTPDRIFEENAAASKLFPEFSLSDEFQKISEAKAHDEIPTKTVYNISDDDIAPYVMVKSVENLRIQPKGEAERERRHQDQRLFVTDDDEDDGIRDARRQAKSVKKKTHKPFIGSVSTTPRHSNRSSGPATQMSAKGTAAESSKKAAARRQSTISLDNPGEQPITTVIKSEIEKTYAVKPLPAWHEQITTIGLNRALKHSDTERTQASRSIASFKGCITRCEKAAADNEPEEVQGKLFEELRDHVHKAEILLKGVDKYVVRKNRMLEEQNGLPHIFMAKKVDYPWDLQADAWQLYLRWYKQDFKPDLLRGIITKKSKDRSSDIIDPERMKDPTLKVSAKYSGEGNLVLGQWWPTQLCAVRDGAHGSSQGGIWGEKGRGAYSIVLSTGGYKDKDNGNEIWYSGTESKGNNEPTSNTQRLIESCEEFPDQAVRVLRTMQLSPKNPYRPKVGLRYDGLYRVVGMERIEEGKEDYLFKLVRLEDQHPIRCENNAARRPTRFEVDEFQRLKREGR